MISLDIICFLYGYFSLSVSKEGRGTDEASVVGRQADLDDVDEVVAHPSNVSNRKTSVISHSTTGDFKTNIHASAITT